MKRTLSFVLAAAAMAPLALIAADAIPAIPDPAYPDKPFGGFKAKSATEAESRCPGLNAAPTAPIAYQKAKPDLGSPTCKHHVWKALQSDADWLREFAKTEAVWVTLAPGAQAEALKQLASRFQSVDGAYLKVLTAARDAWSAYDQGKCTGRADLWAEAAPGPKAAAYYEKLHQFQVAVNAVAKEGPSYPAAMPASVGINDKVAKALGDLDDVLAAHLQLVHSTVDRARTACKPAGVAGGQTVAASGERLGRDLSKWDQAIKGGAVQAALERQFTGAAARPDGTPDPNAAALKASLGETATYTSQTGARYLMQHVHVKDKDGTVRSPYVFTELKDDDTVDLAAQRLINKVKSTQGLMSGITAVAEAARDAAKNPARTAEEMAKAPLQETPVAAVAGQTRADMERKIENEKSDTAAKALSEFADDKTGLQGQFATALAQCQKLWEDSKAEEAREKTVIDRLTGDAKTQALERLQKSLKGKRDLFIVDGPREAKRDEKHLKKLDKDGHPELTEAAKLPCTEGKKEIESAYVDALARSKAELAAANGEAERRAGVEKSEMTTKDNARAQSRRRYFRMGFKDVLTRKVLEGLVTTTDEMTKADTVAQYLDSKWKGADGKFYLKEYDPAKFPPKFTDAQVSEWSAIETGKDGDGTPQPEKADKLKVEGEGRFLENMDDLYPLYRKSVLHSSPPLDDKVVLGEVEKWVKADFCKSLGPNPKGFSCPREWWAAPERKAPERRPNRAPDLVDLLDKRGAPEREAKAPAMKPGTGTGGQP